MSAEASSITGPANAPEKPGFLDWMLPITEGSTTTPAPGSSQPQPSYSSSTAVPITPQAQQPRLPTLMAAARNKAMGLAVAESSLQATYGKADASPLPWASKLPASPSSRAGGRGPGFASQGQMEGSSGTTALRRGGPGSQTLMLQGGPGGSSWGRRASSGQGGGVSASAPTSPSRAPNTPKLSQVSSQKGFRGVEHRPASPSLAGGTGGSSLLHRAGSAVAGGRQAASGLSPSGGSSSRALGQSGKLGLSGGISSGSRPRSPLASPSPPQPQAEFVVADGVCMAGQVSRVIDSINNSRSSKVGSEEGWVGGWAPPNSF